MEFTSYLETARNTVPAGSSRLLLSSLSGSWACPLRAQGRQGAHPLGAGWMKLAPSRKGHELLPWPRGGPGQPHSLTAATWSGYKLPRASPRGQLTTRLDWNTRPKRRASPSEHRPGEAAAADGGWRAKEGGR